MNNRTLWLLLFILLMTGGISPGSRLASLLRSPTLAFCSLLSILIALVVHEFAHALAADHLGDPNPRLAGRLSLNPLKHLDPIGTLLIVLTGFGWGKPVQFDPYNLQDPAKDGAVIAAAGPLSNLLLAALAALLLYFFPLQLFPASISVFLVQFLYIFFGTNVNLAVFNLLPIYPLDGHHILRAFLPESTRRSYDLFNHRFGILVAYLLILPVFGSSSLVSRVTSPAIDLAYRILLGI